MKNLAHSKLFVFFSLSLVLLTILGCNFLVPSGRDTVEPEKTIAVIPEIEPEVAVTEEPVNPPTPVERNRVLVIGGSNVRNGTTGHSKLEALAFTNGIRFQQIDEGDWDMDTNALVRLLKEPDVAGVIFTRLSASASELAAIDNFIKSGGRVIIFYNDIFVDSNDVFQRLFGVTFVNERVIDVNGDWLMSDSMLPSWASGLKVGISNEGKPVWVDCYLVTNTSGGVSGETTGAETGKPRMLYYEDPSGNLTFFPSNKNGYANFFDDHNIDFFDNEGAARAMLKYLIGDK